MDVMLSMLPREQQRYANLFISDVQLGEITVDPTMTFRDYIAKYRRKAEDARIARIVRRLGCHEKLLRTLLDRKAYVEEKVCLDEPKYVERQESGKMRLTSYAKEHEEECFLQFKVDADGKLH